MIYITALFRAFFPIVITIGATIAIAAGFSPSNKEEITTTSPNAA